MVQWCSQISCTDPKARPIIKPNRIVLRKPDHQAQQDPLPPPCHLWPTPPPLPPPPRLPKAFLTPPWRQVVKEERHESNQEPIVDVEEVELEEETAAYEAAANMQCRDEVMWLGCWQVLLKTRDWYQVTSVVLVLCQTLSASRPMSHVIPSLFMQFLCLPIKVWWHSEVGSAQWLWDRTPSQIGFLRAQQVWLCGACSASSAAVLCLGKASLNNKVWQN